MPSKAQANTWYAANKERAYATGAAWRDANPKAVARKTALANWRQRGVNPWPYASHKELYDKRYIVVTHCEYCTIAFDRIKSKTSPRRMDHDHRPPFLFRAICCSRCNGRRGVWDARILRVHEELALAFSEL